MATTLDIEDKVHISRTPDVCGGKACVAGTRIRVQDVYVWHELQRQSPDEIVHRFPQLTLADVYAALAYFWDHRAEILAQIAEAERRAAQVQASMPSPRVAQTSGDDDAVSP